MSLAEKLASTKATRSTIRISIDGDWSAREWQWCLRCYEELYNILFFLILSDQEFPTRSKYFRDALVQSLSLSEGGIEKFVISHGDMEGWTFQSRPVAVRREFPNDLPLAIGNSIRPHESLDVTKVKYGSQGFTDLTGIGEVVGHLKDIVFRIIDSVEGRKDRRLRQERLELENEGLELDNNLKRIRIAGDFIELAERANIKGEELNQLIRVVSQRTEFIEALVDLEKVQGVEEIPESLN